MRYLHTKTFPNQQQISPIFNNYHSHIMTNNNYLYRQHIYTAQLHQQQLAFLKTARPSILTISPVNNPLYYPAKLQLRWQQHILSELYSKQKKSYLEYLFLLVALKMGNRSYHTQLSDFKRAFPNYQHSEEIDKFVEHYSRISPLALPSTSKHNIKYNYQKLIGKGNHQNYLNIPDVPVYLISTTWLERLYAGQDIEMTPIFNQHLLDRVAYPLTDDKYFHYNYRVKQNLRQNDDYKIISYQAWKYLYHQFGGLEVKRFTTKERCPIVQIWHITVTILIIEERCIFHDINLQVSKSDTFAQVLDRVRLILQQYKIVPQDYLKKNMHLYRTRQLSIDQSAALIQDDDVMFINNNKIEKINDLNIQIEEGGIVSHNDHIIVNLGRHDGIFFKTQNIRLLSLKKQRCLNCQNLQDLEECKCKEVFFCSKKCKQARKDHLKQCDINDASNRKYRAVVEYYKCQGKLYLQITKIIEGGKVGLQNLGNTCYMNSSLQCLLRIEPLSKYFLRNQHLKHLNVSNVLGSEGHVACSYGQLIKSFYTTSKKALEPSQILRCISKNPQFRGYNHQDSQQFLNYFLDKLHEDLNKIKTKPYLQEIESNGRSDEVVSQLSWQNYKKRNDSFVSQLLAGQYRSEIRCPDCKRISITFDPFMSVTLQFPKPQKGLQIKGYILNSERQFQQFKVQVKLSSTTYDFIEKYFHIPVKLVNIKEKKIIQSWDNLKSINQNYRQGGTLLAYQKPNSSNIQILIQVYSPNTNNLQSYPRIIFLTELQNKQALQKTVILAFKKHITKTLSKQLTDTEYLELCATKQVLCIKSLLSKRNSQITYPLIGSNQLQLKIELRALNLGYQSLKLNTINKRGYEGKIDCFVKKIKSEVSIGDLLSCFNEPQELTKQNAWYCSVCKDHKLAQKIMSLYKLPENLIIHLKRFNHRGDSGNRYIIYGEKVETPIMLQEYETINGSKYELIGCVNHIGSLMRGHYTALVKRDGWYSYDDSRCTRSSLQGKRAYLLFYRKVG